MSVINPIKDRLLLEKMKTYLREQSMRNYLLFRIGVNLGVPMQDLLYMRIEDIANKSEFNSGDYQIRISKSLQQEIAFYIGPRKEGYLFRMHANKPLSRFQLYNILRDAAEKVGITEKVGALTLRKTFAYWAYQDQRIPLALLSKYLNHHTVSYTLRYIGLKENLISKICLPEIDL